MEDYIDLTQTSYNHVFIRTTQELQTSYLRLWNTYKRVMPSLTEQQLTDIMNVTLNVCSSCHNSTRGCQCWNDE